MGLDGVDVVEVGLPVLDDTSLFGRNQPVVTVRPGARSNGAVVSLHDGLEIPADTIPKGKLATGGTGQKTSAIGRPLDHVDRVSDLVERGMEVLGGNDIDRSGPGG